MRSQGHALLHVVEELYQHLGQAELTRDLLLARDYPAERPYLVAAAIRCTASASNSGEVPMFSRAKPGPGGRNRRPG